MSNVDVCSDDRDCITLALEFIRLLLFRLPILPIFVLEAISGEGCDSTIIPIDDPALFHTLAEWLASSLLLCQFADPIIWLIAEEDI